ncbi:MAG: hypothetical protein AB7S87_15045 [Burkholderiales bacterium]
MADDRDILGKADALLRRHVPGRAADGADVPVLTELITPGGRAPAPAEPAPPEAGPASFSEEERRALVAEVVEAVRSRLAQDLERRLAPQVLAEVHASIAATLGDLRHDIARAVGEAVADALARHPKR